jgi:hypothetical protein
MPVAPQPGLMPGDGQLRQDGFNPNDQTAGQAIRAAVNAGNE